MRRPSDPADARRPDLKRTGDVRFAAAATGTFLLLALLARALDSSTLFVFAGAIAGAALLRLARASSRPEPAAPLQLPQTSPEQSLRDAVHELQRQTERVCEWSGATAVTLWQCDADRLRPIAAAGRPLPPVLPTSGEPLGWVAREGMPLWLDPTPHWRDRKSVV